MNQVTLTSNTENPINPVEGCFKIYGHDYNYMHTQS